MNTPVTWGQVAALAGALAAIEGALWLRWVALGCLGSRERR